MSSAWTIIARSRIKDWIMQKGGYGNWLLSLVALNSRHRARNVLTLFEFRDGSMSVVFELNVIPIFH